MRIDVHAHYWTEEYLDLLIDLGKAARGGAGQIMMHAAWGPGPVSHPGWTRYPLADGSVVGRCHELVRMTSCWVARVIAT
jgi:hypothetical protein